MANCKFSKLLRDHIKPILEEDLRSVLNKYMQELEINKKYTKKWIKATYGDKLEKNGRTVEEVFQFIINDISNYGYFKRKRVKGKPYVYFPEKSKAPYAYISNWKTKMAEKLDAEFGVGKEFGKEFHLGHGASSLAAVEYRAAKAASVLVSLKNPDAQAALGVINKKRLYKGLDIEQFVDDNFEGLELKRDYEVRLKLEAAPENLAASEDEKKFIKVLKRITDRYLKQAALDGCMSPTPVKRIDKAIDDIFSNKPKKKGKGKDKSKEYIKSKAKEQNGTFPAVQKQRMRRENGQFTSPISLMNLINSRLHNLIRKNMGSPALNYQTGRFARSVKVTNISQTRQSQMTAFYTYMKSPYQTFERGYAQGSPQRDPRKLISKSIREAAAEVMGARFDIRTRRQ